MLYGTEEREYPPVVCSISHEGLECLVKCCHDRLSTLEYLFEQIEADGGCGQMIFQMLLNEQEEIMDLVSSLERSLHC